MCMPERGCSCMHICTFIAADLLEAEQPHVPMGVNLGHLLSLTKQRVQASVASSRANDSPQVWKMSCFTRLVLMPFLKKLTSWKCHDTLQSWGTQSQSLGVFLQEQSVSEKMHGSQHHFPVMGWGSPCRKAPWERNPSRSSSCRDCFGSPKECWAGAGWLHIDCHLPCGQVVKNLPASAGYAGDTGWIPGLVRYPGGGNGNPLQYSCLGNPTEEPGGQVYGVTQSRTCLRDWACTLIVWCWPCLQIALCLRFSTFQMRIISHALLLIIVLLSPSLYCLQHNRPINQGTRCWGKE